MTRRECCSALLAAAAPRWESGGVVLGGQSYSFRHLPLDEGLEAWRKLGVRSLEVYKNDIEPKRAAGETPAAYRQRIREWRTSVPMDVFAAVRRKMEAMGLTMSAYMYDFRDDFTEAEMARGFEMGRALGVTMPEHHVNAERGQADRLACAGGEDAGGVAQPHLVPAQRSDYAGKL